MTKPAASLVPHCEFCNLKTMRKSLKVSWSANFYYYTVCRTLKVTRVERVQFFRLCSNHTAMFKIAILLIISHKKTNYLTQQEFVTTYAYILPMSHCPNNLVKNSLSTFHEGIFKCSLCKQTPF